MTRHEVEKLDFGDWPVAQAYLVEVGRLALVWSRLEVFVASTVVNLEHLGNSSDQQLQPRRFDENLKLLAQIFHQQLVAMPNLKNYAMVLEKLYQAEVNKNLYLNGSMRSSPVSCDVEITVLTDALSGEMVHKKLELIDLKRALLQIDEAQHELYKLVCAMERPARKIK